jgi:hypothetical protein
MVTPLQAAFITLNHVGLVAREHLACCTTCGHADSERLPRQSSDFGYAFYHAQDTESASHSGKLYIGFSSFDPAKKETQRVGKLIVKTLRNEGLKCSWNGDSNERICVHIGDEDKTRLQQILDDDRADFENDMEGNEGDGEGDEVEEDNEAHD